MNVTKKVAREKVFRGIGVSPGIVIARALVYEHQTIPVFRVPLTRHEIKGEVDRANRGRNETKRQLALIKKRTEKTLGQDHSYIFEAQMLMLEDDLFVDRIENLIRQERVNAEWAVKTSTEELTSMFEKVDQGYFRERGSDVNDVASRLIRNIAGNSEITLGKLEKDYIVMAEDVRPSDVTQLDRDHTVGLAMEAGGQTYHTAIIARSMGIPCVVGVPSLMQKVEHGTPIVLDGSTGSIIVSPTKETLREYKVKRRKQHSRSRRLSRLQNLPAETTDGRRIVIQANIEFPEECESVIKSGGEGIGLFRTEWLLNSNSGTFPSEEAQYRIYRRVAKKMRPSSVIVRAFDLSAEHFGNESASEFESNPAMGLRAIRLLLKHRHVFREQLRALLRARVHGNIQVMFPMISGVGELREAMAEVERAKQELESEGRKFGADLPCGITLEVPSAAAIADLLAKEVDFFSLGTNDLIQYFLGVDRGNDQVSYLYEPLHPAILRSLRFSIESAHAAGIPVGMCGEMASEPLLVALLVGFDIDELSMSAHSIPVVKNIIRHLAADDARGIAEQALDLSTVKEVSRFLERELRKLVPDLD